MMEYCQVRYNGLNCSIPVIRINGQYMASYNHVHNYVLLLELETPIVPGGLISKEASATAKPKLIFCIEDARSIAAIRGWLDRIERSIKPKWVYHDGD